MQAGHIQFLKFYWTRLSWLNFRQSGRIAIHPLPRPTTNTPWNRRQHADGQSTPGEYDMETERRLTLALYKASGWSAAFF